MRRHPVIGHEILKGSASKYVRMGALIALGHHEKYDGSGYPNGLVGDHIPLCARIVAVADVYDALTSVRPYKQAWPSEQAFEYLARAARPALRSAPGRCLHRHAKRSHWRSRTNGSDPARGGDS